MQIVIAWLEEDQVIVKRGRTDLGELHKFKTAMRPVACMWLNNGGAADLSKAKSYAAKEGYRVFSYNGEKDPLGKARQDICR